MKSIDFRTNWIADFLPIGSLWLETSATALRGPYVNITLVIWMAHNLSDRFGHFPGARTKVAPACSRPRFCSSWSFVSSAPQSRSTRLLGLASKERSRTVSNFTLLLLLLLLLLEDPGVSILSKVEQVLLLPLFGICLICGCVVKMFGDKGVAPEAGMEVYT